MIETDKKSTGRKLLPLWLLMAVFGLPMLLAWVFYMNPKWLPLSSGVNGELIQPPIALPRQVLPIHDGSKVSLKSLEGQWILVALYGESCDDSCRSTLRNLRQLRLALGRDRLRLNRILVLDRFPPGEAISEILDPNPDLRIVETNALILEASQTQTGMRERHPAGTLLVIDPLGNLMMHYPPDTAPRLVLEDMDHLMTVTKNWNKGCAVCPAIN